VALSPAASTLARPSGLVAVVFGSGSLDGRLDGTGVLAALRALAAGVLIVLASLTLVVLTARVVLTTLAPTAATAATTSITDLSIARG
jgi:hypothetical protein